jgi:hypothetical protein
MRKEHEVKERLLVSLVAGIAACSMAEPVAADFITLSLEPETQTVAVGDLFDVNVVISGLGTSSAPSLGAFDIAFFFDSLLLAVDSVSIGDPVEGDQLDLMGFGTLSGDGAIAGGWNIFEISLDSADDLNSMQLDSFVLATVTFEALDVGLGELSMSIDLPWVLADAYGAPLTATLEGASVAIVPLPAAVWLGMLGLGMVGAIKRVATSNTS